mgnify:CR=1 FL=1
MNMKLDDPYKRKGKRIRGKRGPQKDWARSEEGGLYYQDFLYSPVYTPARLYTKADNGRFIIVDKDGQKFLKWEWDN